MLFFWVSNGLSPKYWRVPKAAAIWSALGQESKAPAKLHQLVGCGARCFRCFENVSVIICVIISGMYGLYGLYSYAHTVIPCMKHAIGSFAVRTSSTLALLNVFGPATTCSNSAKSVLD